MCAHNQCVNTPVVLHFRSGDTPDPRRYNEPSGRDIAAIFTGDRPPSRRDISVYDRSSTGTGDTHDVSYLNEHVDPMTYPLLFPVGDKGWCPGLQVARTTTEPPSHKNKLGACELMRTSSWCKAELLACPTQENNWFNNTLLARSAR